MTIRDIVVAIGFDIDKKSENVVENSIKGIKNMAGKLLGGIAVAFSVTKLAAFGKDCAQAASDVEQMQSKFDVVFGDISKEVDNWATQFADSVGRNKNAIKTYLADQQNLLVGFGMTREEGAKLSEEMTSLAMDIASFANLDETTAVNAMSKALMGESESAKTLGAVLNDSTREAAMLEMGLTGSYNSLDQLAKMQVNYTAIAMQSKDAIGDCVRSLDSYESRQRQLSAAVQEFKEFIGGQIIPVMSVFVGWTTQGVKAATKFAEAILLDADGNNRLLLSFDRIHATVKKLQPAMERMSASISFGIGKANDSVKNISDKLGGMTNVIKTVAIAAGSLFLAMKWDSVIKIASSIKNAILGIGKAIMSVKLKTVGIAAAIAIIALLIDDFINFLMGNDSIIGTVFDKLGIGADNARQAIFNAFGKIKNFFTRTWTEIKSAFSKHGESLKTSVKKIFKGLVTIAGEVFKPIVAIATAIFVSLGDAFDSVDLSTPINAAVSVLDLLVGALGSVGEFITNHSDLVGVLVKAYGAFKLGSLIAQLSKLTSAFILSTAAKVKDAAETLYIKGLYAKDFVLSIKNTVVALASQAKAFAASIAAKVADKAETLALQAMYAKDFVTSLVSSTAALVKQAAQFAVNTAAKAADAVAQGAMTAATLAWNVAATVATTVTTALGAAMAFLTSPIGLVILAIGALIAIGVLLYKNWDKVKEFASSMWNKVASAFESGVNKIKAFMSGVIEFVKSNWKSLLLLLVNPFAGAFKLLYDNCEGFRNFINQFLENVKTIWKNVWGAISGFLIGIWNGIVLFVSGVLAKIKGIISNAIQNTKNTIKSVLTAIMNVFIAIWGSIVKTVTSVFEKIKSAILSGISAVKSTVSSGLSAIKSAFAKIWNSIVTTLNSVWQKIKNTASSGVNTVKTVISNCLTAIKTNFAKIWKSVILTIGNAWNKIKSTTSSTIAAVKTTISNRLSAIKATFVKIWNSVISTLKSVWNNIKNTVSTAISNVKSTITSKLSAIKSNFVSVWNSIKSLLSNTLNNILSKVKTTFSNVLSSIKGSVGKVKGTVVNGFNAAINWIKQLPSKALTWGSDIISGIVKGIKGAIGKVKDAVKGVADTIKSYLHFSVPDVGPLTDYESWMPDFMNGLAGGIKGNKSVVIDQVKDLAAGMNLLMKSATANPATAAGGIVNNSSSTRNVTQNVNISNSYSGEAREVQKNISKSMNKSAVDATTQMARALAYSRG